MNRIYKAGLLCRAASVALWGKVWLAVGIPEVRVLLGPEVYPGKYYRLEVVLFECIL